MTKKKYLTAATLQVLSIAVISIVAGVCSNQMRSSGIPLVAAWTIEERMAEETGGTMIIPIFEAEAAFKENRAIFQDARDETAFSQGHITGAKNLPWHHIVLPWMELVLGLCLLFNIWTAGASAMAAGLMALFISIISFNLMRGLDVECGCFSATASESMSALTLIRDLVFLLLSIGFAGLAIKQYHRNFAKE